jgi:hypothetical protein
VRQRSGAAWVLWAFLAALGLWSVPTMIYGLAIVAFWLVLLGLLDVNRSLRLEVFMAYENALLAAAGIAYVLYQPALGQPGFQYNEAAVPPGFLRLVWDSFSLGYGPLWWLLAAGAIAAIVLHRAVSRYRAPLWFAIAVVVPISVAVSNRVPPFVRTWVFLLPLLLLVAAAGLIAGARYAARWLPTMRHAEAAAVLVPVAFAVGLGAAVREHTLFTRDDPPTHGAPAAVSYLLSHWRPGVDGLAIGRFTAPAIQFYFYRAGLALNAPVGPVLGISPPLPRRRTYLVLLDVRPPTLADAEGAYAPLKGSRVVKTIGGGAIYVSPPAPRR